ncbi:hypothetical protein [Soonwooa purpurea]
MGFEADFKLMDINDFIKKLEDTIETMLHATLLQLQIFAKNNTYSTKPYKDRTNNLRSSIGFALFKNGELIKSSFSNAGTGGQGDGSEGVKVGTEIAGDSSVNAVGYTAVFVAGMNYAREVENKGYDVLTSSFMQFDNIFANESESLAEMGVNIKLVTTKKASFDDWLSDLKKGDL